MCFYACEDLLSPLYVILGYTNKTEMTRSELSELISHLHLQFPSKYTALLMLTEQEYICAHTIFFFLAELHYNIFTFSWDPGIEVPCCWGRIAALTDNA